MRNDLHKVVIERPRHTPYNAGKSIKRRLQREMRDMDSMPTKESMEKQYLSHRKDFTDLWGPIKRWLATQARRGRRWNDVFSELSERVTRDNSIHRHLLGHMLEMVAIRVTLVNGKPQPYPGEHLWRHMFWVHPDTGILMKMPDEPRKKKAEHLKIVSVDRLNKYVLVDGRWMLVKFKEFPLAAYTPEREPELVTDWFLGDKKLGYYGYGRYEVSGYWGGDIYAVSARGLGKKEQRRLDARLGKKVERRTERSAKVR